MRRRLLGRGRSGGGETAIDISTATFVQESSVALTGSNIKSIYITEDGTKLYYAQGSSIYRYDFSTPYDVSTISYLNNSISLNSGLEGWTMKPDGTKLFTVYFGSGIIKEYSLSTPFDIASPIFVQDGIINDQGSGVLSLSFSADGTELFVLVNGAPDLISRYSLSTAWDISTLSYVSNTHLSSSVFYDLIISDTGEDIFYSNLSTYLFRQMSLPVPFDITSRESISTNEFYMANLKSGFILTQAKKMYLLNGSTKKVSEYNL